jgi:flagellar hook-length control protein FliK
MPQIAIIQPATPQAPPANSAVNNDPGQFSPHLENAISNKNPHATSNKKNNPDSSVTTENEEAILLGQDLSETISELFTLPTTEAKNLPSISNITPVNPQNFTAGSLLANSQISEKPVLNLASRNGSVDLAKLNGSVDMPRLNGSADLAKTNGSLELGQLLQATDETIEFSEVKLATTPTPIQTRMNSGSEALLSRLQQIINNSSETSTVSITKTESSPAILASSTEQISGFQLPGKEGVKTAPDQQLNSVRLGSQQQYYEAKVNHQNSGNNNATPQDSGQGNDPSSQPMATAQQSALAGDAEAASTFSQGSAIVQETLALTSVETAKPIILPSGTVVHEDDVVQQLIERFQISGKMGDTKINIKLNPAELGELKIDISVKDGSIKAHVVAQSQYALDIIDKNLSKLRAVLEDQGFVIDEISVTSESESVGDFNLFDSQLFNQNDYTPQAGKDTTESGAILNTDNILQDDAGDTSGVNVRI